MPSENNEHRVYIVVSQTGTILSQILKIITGAKYNHASLSLDPSLRKMYSFGRLNPYNPFLGGFVVESPRTGTFKRFYKTDAVILSVCVDEDTYNKLGEFLDRMYEKRKSYHYNYLGLILAAFGLCYKHHNSYYCSEFVRDLLLEFNIAGDYKFKGIVKPIHFLDLPVAKEIYRGRLRRYRV